MGKTYVEKWKDQIKPRELKAIARYRLEHSRITKKAMQNNMLDMMN